MKLIFFYFLTSTNSWLPRLIVFGFLTTFVGVIFILGRIVFAQRMKARKAAKPLCAWEYSATEWRQYAKDYSFSAYPNGSAKVKITPLDIWIQDDKRNVNKELDGVRKCVTDCRFAHKILRFRVRYRRSGTKGGTQYYAYDYELPVPTGKEKDALEIVDYFKKKISENSNKIAQITPDDVVTGLFGEAGF